MDVSMLKTVQIYMDEHNMITKGDRIVIGVSGGADSVCLFHVLLHFMPRFNLTLFVVHVNHGMRGKESDGDEAYVKKICEENIISYKVIHADIPAIAAAQGLSEEEAGRKVRYEVFYQCCEENRCNKIAVAHNKNDSAETILFHLFRGSGMKGLTGIPATRDLVIRPLLCMNRNEIEAYLEERHIIYRIDQSNLTEDYSRNKIRHRIIDYAQKEINAKAIDHIVAAAGQLKEIEQYVEENVEIAYNKVVSKQREQIYYLSYAYFDMENIVIQKGIIRCVFKNLGGKLKDIDALHVNLVLDLMEKEVGKRLDLPLGILAVKEYQGIIMKLKDSNEEDVTYHLNQPEESSIGEISIEEDKSEYYIPQINKFLHVKRINYKKSMIIPKDGYTKWFDYDKIENTALIRTRNEGDFIQINSKGSRKKIKSLFIDNKIPKERRDSLPLLADGSHIMWIIGDRISEAYKVSEETKVILEISLNGGKSDGKQ